jgi:hypothetical protein
MPAAHETRGTSLEREKLEKMKLLTEKMTQAHIGVHIKNLACKIEDSKDVVALSSINGQHVLMECR